MTGEPPDLSEIRSSPHWLVRIRPHPYGERLPRLGEAFSTVERTRVQLRGWDFPHINRRSQPIIRPGWIGSADDFHGHHEFWRVHTSGQFLYLSSVREQSEPNWDAKLRQVAAHQVSVEQGFDWGAVPGFIEIVNLVYSFTEYFEFAAKFTQALPDVREVEIKIGLFKAAGFVLGTDEFRRAWWNLYQLGTDEVENAWKLPLVELVTNSGAACLEALRWFVEQFGWLDANVATFAKDRDDLINRRI